MVVQLLQWVLAFIIAVVGIVGAVGCMAVLVIMCCGEMPKEDQ